MKVKQKRFLSILLSLVLALGLLQGTSLTALSEPPSHTHGMSASDSSIEFAPWSQTESLPGSSDLTGGVGSFYLTADVSISGTWVLPENSTINLCLNGHSIHKTTVVGSVIEVPDGTTLKLCDCNTNTPGAITCATDSSFGGTATFKVTSEKYSTTPSLTVVGGKGTQQNPYIFAVVES